MTTDKDYMELVERYFKFLTIDFNFKVSKRIINGNAFYEVRYTDGALAISISYENIADYLQVLIYDLDGKTKPNYNDKEKVFNLNKLTGLIFPLVTKTEIDANNDDFTKLGTPDTKLSKMLLKSAKELSLYFHYCNRFK